MQHRAWNDLERNTDAAELFFVAFNAAKNLNALGVLRNASSTARALRQDMVSDCLAHWTQSKLVKPKRQRLRDEVDLLRSLSMAFDAIAADPSQLTQNSVSQGAELASVIVHDAMAQEAAANRGSATSTTSERQNVRELVLSGMSNLLVALVNRNASSSTNSAAPSRQAYANTSAGQAMVDAVGVLGLSQALALPEPAMLMSASNSTAGATAGDSGLRRTPFVSDLVSSSLRVRTGRLPLCALQAMDARGVTFRPPRRAARATGTPNPFIEWACTSSAAKNRDVGRNNVDEDLPSFSVPEAVTATLAQSLGQTGHTPTVKSDNATVDVQITVWEQDPFPGAEAPPGGSEFELGVVAEMSFYAPASTPADANKSPSWSRLSVNNLPNDARVHVDLPLTPAQQRMKSAPKCLWWNEAASQWSDSGCFVFAAALTFVTCSCNHLTHFAVAFPAALPAFIQTDTDRVGLRFATHGNFTSMDECKQGCTYANAACEQHTDGNDVVYICRCHETSWSKYSGPECDEEHFGLALYLVLSTAGVCVVLVFAVVAQAQRKGRSFFSRLRSSANVVEEQHAMMLQNTAIDFADLKLGRKFACGASGQCFEATYQRHHKCCVKEVYAAMLDSGQLSEFMQEIHMLSGVRHPAIIDYWGFCASQTAGESGTPRHLIVMELASCSLRRAFDDLRRLGDRERNNLRGRGREGGKISSPFGTSGSAGLTAAVQVASALDFLHSRNVLHRDIKPENVLLMERPRAKARDPLGAGGVAAVVARLRAKLCDLGLSRYQISVPMDESRKPAAKGPLHVEAGKATADVRLHQMTMACGTPHYMAPELLFGNGRYDASVDVYALGITLWELITLKEPYGSIDTLEVMHSVVHNDARPDVQDAGVPADLRGLLGSMWSKEPSARPSAHEVSLKLSEYALTQSRRHPALARHSIGAGEQKFRPMTIKTHASDVLTPILNPMIRNQTHARDQSQLDLDALPRISLDDTQDMAVRSSSLGERPSALSAHV